MKLITLGIVQIRLEAVMDGAGCCDIATSSPPPEPAQAWAPGKLAPDRFTVTRRATITSLHPAARHPSRAAQRVRRPRNLVHRRPRRART
ncbi:hypothetical protein Ato02nite_065050 [Paractinoplanes toevensis]|uniref:Uncharacterized protein n=1 Tax=Paractinoplanes toevensis TaxID=571911 RepID=A0A919W3F5_9ACTN|nr:hypothetical protein Ato02nite_065050 [Actinoplanes toevensis]